MRDNAPRDLKYITFTTNAGWVGILSSAKRLLRTTFPQPSSREAYRQLGHSANYATRSLYLFDDLIERFRTYFHGYGVTFPDKLDSYEASHFQQEVWETTKLIPYGETRSYAWVAKKIKKPQAMRAVGQALGKNPLPIIVPCHRVIASDGKLGGFSGGMEMKKHLLFLEEI